MDWHIVALAGHLVGFALGAGGATISDITFLNAIRERKLSPEKFKFLITLSKVIWIGFILLVLSGVAMFALIYSERHALPMLSAAKWQAKLALVGIVLINGIYFKTKVFSALRAMINQDLNLNNIGVSLWKLAIPGTISILSWYGILALSVLPRGLKTPLWYFVFIYAVLLIAGIIISKTILTKLLNNYKLSVR